MKQTIKELICLVLGILVIVSPILAYFRTDSYYWLLWIIVTYPLGNEIINANCPIYER